MKQNNTKKSDEKKKLWWKEKNETIYPSKLTFVAPSFEFNPSNTGNLNKKAKKNGSIGLQIVAGEKKRNEHERGDTINKQRKDV